jgi:hypothetical protein
LTAGVDASYSPRRPQFRRFRAQGALQMLEKLLMAVSLLALPLTLTSCDKQKDISFTVPSAVLKPGGVFVAHSLGCDRGCQVVARGDLIQEIDAKPVATTADYYAANLADGKPHKLKLLKLSGETIETEIVAQPNDKLPPIKGAPPFWAVGAQELNEAPTWARRRIFGHASPQILLASTDGGFIDGRSFHGKKRFIVYFDWKVRTDQAYAATFLKVLQKAQGDLNAKGVDIYFGQLQFPPCPNENLQCRAPMNDQDLRSFHNEHQVRPEDGGPLPFLPMYRWPNATEYQDAKVVGMEGAYTVREALGEAPAILLMDEHGTVRWHSEGVEEQPPGAENQLPPDVYTIIEAVKFALEKL